MEKLDQQQKTITSAPTQSTPKLEDYRAVSKVAPYIADGIVLLLSKNKTATARNIAIRRRIESDSVTSISDKSKSPYEEAMECKKYYQRAFKLAIIYAAIAIGSYLFMNGGWFVLFIKWILIIALGVIGVPAGIITGSIYKSKYDKLMK